jgi:hypothetical protein
VPLPLTSPIWLIDSRYHGRDFILYPPPSLARKMQTQSAGRYACRSTCGAALHEILRSAAKQPPSHRHPIFLASLGPGLLFGGAWLTVFEMENRKQKVET